MKPFIRIKVINGKEYLYEITPYYDPESKRIRHKSKYLGKNINGKPVKVRQKLPVRAYSYGEFLPFIKIIEEFKIAEILGEYLNDIETQTVLAIALNRVTHPLALKHIGTWYEGIYLYDKATPVEMSSQRLSRLLEKIGKSSLYREFHRAILKQLKTERTLLYDISSLSSYSSGIGILEWGYNRDGDALPQVNISLVVDRQEGVPVMYEVYPGSIVDVSTLSNTLRMLKEYGVKDCMMVLDRGFFSTSNIVRLQDSGIQYIIAASMRLKSIKKAVSSAQKALKRASSMNLYRNEPVFVVDIEVEIRGVRVKGYCYYNPKRQKEEEERFYRRLYEIKRAIEGLRISRREKLTEVVEEIAGPYSKYFRVRKEGTGVVVSFREKAISQRTNRMGKFIILYSGDIDWQECLANYRSKDLIEKGFDILKNDLEFYTPGVHKESTLRGLLFICFISLFLRMRLMKKMQDSGLIERYSITGLLTELGKIKMIELSDGERMTTELTKKQKDILNSLRLCA